jgi:hypothetical protein
MAKQEKHSLRPVECAAAAGVLVSQTVISAPAGGGGYDAAKRIKGGKRHMVMDTDMDMG